MYILDTDLHAFIYLSAATYFPSGAVSKVGFGHLKDKLCLADLAS